MKWRLREGQGEALYEIGVEDDGTVSGKHESMEYVKTPYLSSGLTLPEMEASMHTLRKMADSLNASVTILVEKEVVSTSSNAVKRYVAEVLVRKVPESRHFDEIRLAILGSAEVGK